MRKLIASLVAVFFVVSPLHAKGRTPPKDDQFYMSLSTTTCYFSTTTIHWDSPQNYLFIDHEQKTILKVDQDGDVFLREKWIGWDRRLSKKYRDGVEETDIGEKPAKEKTK